MTEWTRENSQGDAGEFWLVQLDLPAGAAKRLGPVDEGLTRPRHVACARDGRVAVSQTRLGATGYEWRLRVREPDGGWRAISDWGESLTEPDSWSPDSSSLLFRELLDESDAVKQTLGVMSDKAAPSVFRETPLADPSVVNAVWAVDGSKLFAFALDPTPRVVVIQWPSQEETTVLETRWPSGISIAEDTGTLVWCTDASGGEELVWRMQRGGRPESTSVVLPSPLLDAVVSTNGKLLAVVQGKLIGDGTGAMVSSGGGVVVYDLDGTGEYRLPDTEGLNVVMLRWVLGGRGLIYTVVPEGLDAWEEKATGRQVWLARLP